jgi:ribosome-binding protein aMBF1 (putative translation factor)
MMITPHQCRSARELVDWSREDLQKKTKLARETIGNFERGNGNLTMKTLEILKTTFETAGIEFVDDGDRLGVVILKNKIKKTKK